MKRSAAVLALVLAVLLAAQCYRPRMEVPPPPSPEQSIIPRPSAVERLPGTFVFSPGVRFFVEGDDPQAVDVARYLARRMKTAAGFEPAVEQGAPSGSDLSVIFRTVPAGTEGPEAYDLMVGPREVVCSAAAPAGLFYGVQTLLQLLPPQVFADRPAEGVVWSIPCLHLTDSPRYKWRGMMLDVCRHFFPKEFVKKFIDFLALHKMNTFHWHLTDDQGWRIEIKRYPRLTEVGAWRVDREDQPWRTRDPQEEGEPATYGGFYTQDDIREVVDYARSRFVTIVPEIEMPGHCAAALAAYPEYSCTGGPFTVPPGSVWPPIFVYCPGNPKTFEFLENVLSEVVELFPGPFVHVGGDEVDKTAWKASDSCRELMAAEGLQTYEELQSYFIRRIEEFLETKDKRLVGWDEILEGGIAPKATVMSWRGTEGGVAAARQGHDVVMSPTSNCYFDYYQGSPELEPTAIGGYLPLSRVYAFEPTPPELTPEEAVHILGAQANLWTEFVPTTRHAEYMVFPRIAAMAEVGWTAKDNRGWAGFKARLSRQFERYEAAGINWSRSSYEVRFFPEVVAGEKAIRVRLDTESHRPEIRFTLDGRPPAADSPLYREPVRLTRTTEVKAAAFKDGEILKGVTGEEFLVHKALGCVPRLARPFSDQHPGGGPTALTDGVAAAPASGDRHWQGFEGDDLEATIDLGRRERIRELRTGFLHDPDDWIFLPLSVEYLVSDNGRDFRSVASLDNDLAAATPGVQRKEFPARLEGVKARYVRVRARSIGTCPPGHPGAGEKAWLFADEIVVD
jgi:hexosaminidase